MEVEKEKRKKKKALTGFEPVISCLLDRRFNQLSHRATCPRKANFSPFIDTPTHVMQHPHLTEEVPSLPATDESRARALALTGGFTNCGMICGRTTLLFTAITCGEKIENLEGEEEEEERERETCFSPSSATSLRCDDDDRSFSNGVNTSSNIRGPIGKHDYTYIQ